MSKADMPKLVVFGDPAKGEVADVIADFAKFVEGRARIVANCDIAECTTEMLEQVDYAVVFGGDGSIISAARALSRSDVPVIGVNLGKLGFLAEFSVEELKVNFDKILNFRLKIEKRMMLSCSVRRRQEQRLEACALNDVFIAAGAPFRMVELQISVDGQRLAGCVSDGLVICTPTGSTAYNLSAGGPILSGNMEAMVVAPLCPHSLSFRPIVISARSKVEVIGVRVNKGTTVAVDGQICIDLTEDDVVTVQRGGSDFLVVNNPGRTAWDALAAKLSWAEKPRYKK
jgi:NAD+ kinase